MSTLNKLYGRRKGRPLRPEKQKINEEMMGQVQIELPLEGFLPLDASRCLHLEIGFGGGEHLAGQAEKNPTIDYIGCEAFLNGVVSLLKHIKDKQLTNVKVYPDDARALVAKLPNQSVERIYILFPDPWPKIRHHKRRLISLPVLEELSRVVKVGGELRIATDDDSYAEWIDDILSQQKWFQGPVMPIHEQPEDWVPTRYQARAIRLGNVCRFYQMRRA